MAFMREEELILHTSFNTTMMYLDIHSLQSYSGK